MARIARDPNVWVTTTYFAEGFPYALVNNVAEVLFKELGASLQAIGLTAVFHLPWNLKFLWAPWLDEYETKRKFLTWCEYAIIVLLIPLFVLGASIPIAIATLCFLALAFVSATHDAAIDGYYLEALDEAGQSRYVGYRAAAYRVATLVATGPLLVLVGVTGWSLAWLAAIATMVALVGYHQLLLPSPESRRVPLRDLLGGLERPRVRVAIAVIAALALLQWRFDWWADLRAPVRDAIARIPLLADLSLEGWIGAVLLLVFVLAVASIGRWRAVLSRRDSNYARAFLDFLDQPRIGRVLGFIVLYRVGESFLMKMRQPFLRDVCEMSLTIYGVINGTLGFAATVLGTIVGGWLIARGGLRKFLWPCVLAQNLPNLAYAAVAFAPEPGALGDVVVGSVVIFEDFGAGMGTAVFMIYLMRCCDPRHKASHMAILTALMSLGFTFAGVASGFIAERMGFGPFFLLTFAATIPSMVLLPFVPYLDRSRAEEQAAAGGVPSGPAGSPDPQAPDRS